MDPGTILGIAGVAIALPPLLETCLHGFDTFTAGRKQAETSEKFIAMLAIYRLRLFCWGHNLGLTNDVDYPINPALNEAIYRTPIEGVLRQLKSLFTDGEKLESQYGVKPQPYNPNQIDEPRNVFSETYERYAQKLRSTSQLPKMTKWAVHDEAKFQKMLDEINRFISSLESLNGPLGIQQRPLRDVEQAITKISNEHDLRLVQSAAMESGFQPAGRFANQRLLALNPDATPLENVFGSISISGESTPSFQISTGHTSPAHPQTASYFPRGAASNQLSISSQPNSPSPPPYADLASPPVSLHHSQSQISLPNRFPSPSSSHTTAPSTTSTIFHHFDEAAYHSYVVAQPDATLQQLETDLDKNIGWSNAAIGAGIVGGVLTMGATLAGSAVGARTSHVYKLQRNIVQAELGRRGIKGKKEARKLEKERLEAQNRVQRWAIEDAKSGKGAY